MLGNSNSKGKLAGSVLPEELILKPTKEENTGENIQYDDYTGPFESTSGKKYDSADKIKVRKIGAWIDSEISADNIRKGHTILGVAGNVKELIEEEITVKSATSSQTITPSGTATGITKVTVNPVVYQSKTVNPLLETQTIRASSGFDALSSVTVKPIDIEYLKEQDADLTESNIKKGVNILGITGTYEPEPDIRSITITPSESTQKITIPSDIDGYGPITVNPVTASVDSSIQPGNIRKNVNILGVTGTYAPVTEELMITPSINTQKFTPAKGIDGYNSVSVEPVTAGIDKNIIPSNIKRDVEILGVTGTYTTENLQNKTVDPKQYIQTVTYDSTLGYEGLDTVTVNAVTASIDSAIASENIKKGVEILGVEGTYEGRQPVIQQPVSVEPKTLPQTVTPDVGFDGLGGVNVAAVTASIDPNILAENIKKNISILGVTGTYDNPQNNQESKTITPSISGDIVITPDDTYDALLKVIVKAVTASIDPNILPKNIKKNVSILGVMGTLEEGGEQKWFDFSGTSNYIPIGQNYSGEGGYEAIAVHLDNNQIELKNFVNNTFPSITNVSGVLFTQVYGYDDCAVENNELEQVSINFIGGRFYADYDDEIDIPSQLRYFYPYINEEGVKGLTIGLDEDNGSEHTMNLYLLTTSLNSAGAIPVLVNGTLSNAALPVGFDGFRFIKEITIPTHEVFTPKNIEGDVRWHLRDRNEINTKFVKTEEQPSVLYTSAYDVNNGQEDITKSVADSYIVKYGENIILENNVVKLKNTSIDGFTYLPETFEKQDKCYYYFKFKPNAYYGNSSYYTIANCPGLFVIYVYRNNSNNAWRLGWRSSWSGVDAGSSSNSSSATMYNGNIYHVRVYVNGTSTTIQWSSDGYAWTTIATVTNATYINPTNTNRLILYANNEPQLHLYPEGCYIEKDGIKIYEYFDPIYRKESSHVVLPLKKDILCVSRATDRMIPYYKGNEVLNFEKYIPETKLLKLGAYGYFQILEGFKTSNLNSWEISTHFRVPALSGSANRHIITWLGGGSYKNCIWIDTSHKMHFRLYSGSDSSTILNATTGSYTFITGEEYYLNVRFTGRHYYLVVSLYPDLSNPIVTYGVSSTTKAYASTNYLIYGNYSLDGSNRGVDEIYLDKYAYVKANNKIIWKPLDSELNGNIINYNDNGEPIEFDVYLAEKKNKKIYIQDAEVFGDLKVTDNNILEGFSRINGLRLKNKFVVENNPWEINLKVKINRVNGNSFFFGSRNQENSFLIGIASEKLTLWLSSTYSSWNIANDSRTGNVSLDFDKEYYIRLSYDLSKYLLEVSEDKVTWTTATSVSSTTHIYPGDIYIGSAWDSGNNYLDGCFYLNDFSIKINNEEWFTPKIIDGEENYEYVLTNDSNWTNEDLNKIKIIGKADLPQHEVYVFDYEEMHWAAVKTFNFTLNDEDAILYTEVKKISEGE